MEGSPLSSGATCGFDGGGVSTSGIERYFAFIPACDGGVKVVEGSPLSSGATCGGDIKISEGCPLSSGASCGSGKFSTVVEVGLDTGPAIFTGNP